MLQRPAAVSRVVGRVAFDVVAFLRLSLYARASLAAENLFLRKQLALYVERQVTPRRADPATRVALVVLARVIDWKSLLTVVKPETLIRWHRAGWRLFWRWRSRPRGRPRIPRNLLSFAKKSSACSSPKLECPSWQPSGNVVALASREQPPSDRSNRVTSEPILRLVARRAHADRWRRRAATLTPRAARIGDGARRLQGSRRSARGMFRKPVGDLARLSRAPGGFASDGSSGCRS